jgi:hypothetical protein
MTRAVVGAACAVVSAGLWGVLAAQRAAHVRRDVSRQPWRKVLGTGWPMGGGAQPVGRCGDNARTGADLHADDGG